MSGTTTNGLPYPTGSDLVVNGDDAIRALAEKIDPNLLPHGYARARTTQAVSHGAAAWNTAQLDVLTDSHGDQPWTLEASNRRIKLTASGLYVIQAALSMSGPMALAIAVASDGGTNYNRIASVPIGGTAYTNAVSAIRYLTAGTTIQLQMYHTTALTTVVDAANTPSYLAIMANGSR